ncbi:MAG: thioredoxin family protein [Nannocystaceae bacterium]
MAVQDLNDENFSTELAQCELAVVDFYAGWCGPCRMFAPKFRRLSEDERYAGRVKFFKLNGEEAPEARKSVTIDNLPFFGIYRNGEFVAGKSAAKEEVFVALLDAHLTGDQ